MQNQDHEQMTDEQLMGAVRERVDERALDALLSRHYARALQLAKRLLWNGPDAEDAVQNAFIRLVRHHRDYDRGRAFGPWFRRLLHNCCLDLLRTRLRHRRKLEAYAALRLSSSGTSEPPRAPVELLASLGGGDRDVLVLRVVQQRSFAEIAEQLGCSEEAAKKRAQRALDRLRSLAAADDRAAAAQADPLQAEDGSRGLAARPESAG